MARGRPSTADSPTASSRPSHRTCATPSSCRTCSTRAWSRCPAGSGSGSSRRSRASCSGRTAPGSPDPDRRRSARRPASTTSSSSISSERRSNATSTRRRASPWPVTFAAQIDGSRPGRQAADAALDRHDHGTELFCDLFCKQASTPCRQVIVVRIPGLPIGRNGCQSIAEKHANVVRKGEQIAE